MFQRGQERAMQLATHFFEHPLPAAQGAIEMLCHHAAEADRAAFPKDDAWTAVCTPCGFSTLPEPKKPAKWKTHLPAFNVADSAICIGAAIILILNVFMVRPEKAAPEKEEKNDGTA